MTSTGPVLVVDDSETNRYILSSWLRRAGYDVVEAGTGEEALRRLSPDLELAVLDVNLPDMSGFEVCQAIKSDPRTASIPVLHVSATAIDVDERVTGLEKGADAYLVEPLEPGEFVASVRALVRYHTARRRAESFVARLSRLSVATLAVHAATSLPDLLLVAAGGASDTFGRGAVVLAAPEQQQVEAALATPGSPPRLVTDGLPSTVPVGLCASSDTTSRWTPAAEAVRVLPLLAEVPEPGWRLAEIRGRSGLLGLLAVAAPDDGDGAGAEEGVAIRHYARVLAVALENLRLFARVALLQRLTAALARARDSDEVAATVVSTVTDALAAQAGTVSLFEEQGTLRTLAGAGLDLEFLARHRLLPVADVPIAGDVLATRRPVLVTSFADRDRRYPFLAGTSVRQQAWANLPLIAGGSFIGLAAFGWTDPRTFPDEEVELLEAVASQCAAALDRARLLDTERAARAAAEAAQERLALLARASAVFAAAAGEDQLLSAVADLLVPIGSWASVLLPDEHGLLVGREVRVADPAQAELADELVGQPLGPLHTADPRAVAFRDGRPAGSDIAALAPLLAAGDPLADQLARLSLAELLAVPLLARGQVLGVLALARAADRPRFTSADIELLGDVGARAGTALDSLRSLAARTRVAATLQASLLPERLPELSRVELAARYLPAEQAAEVGGDFYDAFPLDTGEYALVIGDVSGRGVDAAGLTGLARSTLHAIPPDLGPAAALARLNQLLLARTGPERFLTAAYLRLHLDPDGVDATVCSAGHPLPLLIRSDGVVQPVGEPGPLLGLLDTVELLERSVRLVAGDTLLLYTDGVTEAHGADGLFGDERLTDLLAGAAGQSAARLVDTVQHAVLTYRTGGPDDLAMLALRVLPPTEPDEH
ncbi:MAG TPA: SpoIIE family protein phosphatase, partial [Mycobacteriales bacterium]|nr:SpoIIE family protein phosphatase [Mycobacteriales bacterium]